MRIPWLIVVLALGLPPIASSQRAVPRDPFFDCARPKTDVQTVVCGNETLRYEDQILDESHRRLLALLPEPQKQVLSREQSDWLVQRDRHCAGHVPANPRGRRGIQASDPAAVCIDGMYQKRSEILSARIDQAICPNPATAVQNSCKEFDERNLPLAARAAFEKLGCTGGAWANAVDLNDDGSPEYTVCCDVPPHGACGFVVLGKKGAEWTSLTEKSEYLLGFTPPCVGLTILERKHEGYHDLCTSNAADPNWQVAGGKYHQVKNAGRK